MPLISVRLSEAIGPQSGSALVADTLLVDVEHGITLGEVLAEFLWELWESEYNSLVIGHVFGLKL